MKQEQARRVYAHVRVHALAASIEARERGGRPVVIYDEGGQQVVSASPEAQRRGVRPGMTRWEAERLCPVYPEPSRREVIAVAPDPEKCTYFWQRVLEICGDYTPTPEIRDSRLDSTLDFRISTLDSCFSLDLTGAELLFGPAKEIGLEIRNRLRAEVGVVASVGIGPNPVVAQLACESAKPGVVVEVAPEEAAGFVGRLPIGALPGVDDEWAQRLSDMGLRQAKDFAALPVEAVARAFGERGRRVWEIARGEEARSRRGEKSRSEERRTEQAMSAQAEVRPATEERVRVRAALRAAADDVSRMLRQQGQVARQVEVVIVFNDMRAVGARRTLGQATRSGEVIFRAAGALFERIQLVGRLVRRVRIVVSRLAAGPRGGQMGLPMLEQEQRRERLAERMNQVKDRFGDGAVRRGSAFELTRR
jgi:DNA polymerase-4